MRLRLSPRAARDITEIGAYLYARNPPAAAHVRTEIRRHMEMLCKHPLAGRSVGRGLRRYAVPRLPYLIVYRVNEAAAELFVITLRHTARRPII